MSNNSESPTPTARALVEALLLGMTTAESVTLVAEALTAAHDAGRREGREEMRERAAGAVPMTWLDPLLNVDFQFTREQATIFTEKLLRGVKARIEQLPLDDAARGEELSDG